MTPRRRQTGFTLVELLVALFITAILFAMGYGALTQALGNRKEVEEQAARLNAVQQALRIMEQDIELMQPRPVRDELGNGYQNAVIAMAPGIGASAGSSQSAGTSQSSGTSQSGLSASQPGLLTFTRGGWANPAGLPRSELQRVSYLLRDGKLIRRHLAVLDATAALPYEERELLDQVQTLGFRYMDGGLVWQTTWPTPQLLNGPAQQLLRARPVAIEITLQLKDWGKLQRIVESCHVHHRALNEVWPCSPRSFWWRCNDRSHRHRVEYLRPRAARPGLPWPRACTGRRRRGDGRLPAP